MDAIDNPSYFNFSSDDHTKFRDFLSTRRWSDNIKNTNYTLPNNSTSVRRGSSIIQSRRNFRSLKRATSEDTHLLILGKPRPSDLPPVVYMNKHERQNSAGNVNSNDLLHQDMMHCSGMVDEDDDKDVFLSSNRNVQYYNTATLPVNRMLGSGRRRHSIGSFLHRDRSVENDTKSNEISTRRKFKRISIDKVGNKMVEDELDILLVSCGESEVATMWVDYLISCFQRISIERNKTPFKLQNIKLEDMLCISPNSNIIAKCPCARLQIVIVCPLFFEKIKISSSLVENPLGKVLCPDKVLAMMLGVQDRNENEHLKIVFPHYEYWRKMNVKDQDPTSVGDFLGVAMDILCRTWQMQEMLNLKQQEQTHFSILPKKVKMGQDKLIILFTEPLSSDDTVNVFIDKNGQRIEVTSVKKRNPYTLQFTMPGHCLHVSMLVNVHVEKNGKSVGKRIVKCESRTRELEQLLRLLDNPISFLCQSFGLNTADREQLDSFLLGVFLKNVPSQFHLLNPGIIIDKNYSCNEEFPTLLHFAAKYGLEKLSCQLIESSGGEQACQIRNSSHLTPAEMAEKANHLRLANALKGHMQMTELATMYNYLKGMTNENTGQFSENNYLIPRPVNDTYLIPPTARPVEPQVGLTPVSDSEIGHFPSFYENFRPGNILPLNAMSPTSSTISNSFMSFGLENYEVPLNGRPCTPRTPPTPLSPTEKKIEGYLDMNPTGNESSSMGSVNSYHINNSEFPEYFGNFDKFSETYKTESIFSETHSSSSKYGSAQHLSHRDKLSPDDELLEIINDFKNNVFTIKEVEKLVQEWQNRSDVQQSFKERQEQLNKMREEYDRIQRRMKEEMKRPTPFERFRKFFRRGKPKQSDNSERNSVSSSDICSSNMRASSSISLHSFSSGSSAANSISSGSYVATNGIPKKIEKTDQYKINIYSDIPQPPKFMDLCTKPDFSEYVQPDCMICNNPSRLSNGSVLNDTIHECVEFNQSEKISRMNKMTEIMAHTYCSSVIKDKKKSKDKFRFNSLKIESKNKFKNVKYKVKSAENLISDNEILKPVESVKCHSLESEEDSHLPLQNSEYEQNSKLWTCEVLCAQTIKCLTDAMQTMQNNDIPSDVTFEFDKAEAPRISNTNINDKAVSECGSVNNSDKSSSLNLSSLSLNSNCTIDENSDAEEEKSSLELKITEEGEIETETVPPNVTDQQNYIINICNLPDYINVKVQNSSELSGPSCKYTAVSS